VPASFETAAPTQSTAGCPAPVFGDEDGTLVEDLPYNVDPARLRFTARALRPSSLLGTRRLPNHRVTCHLGVTLVHFVWKRRTCYSVRWPAGSPEPACRWQACMLALTRRARSRCAAGASRRPACAANGPRGPMCST
jgi:hypothetical protein